MKSLRQLLRERHEWMEARIFEGAERKGYGGITPAMSRLYGQISREPIGLSELARQMGISRQAIHKMVGEGVQAGFLELVDSEEDRRIKLVRFSLEGLRMADAARQEMESIEQELAERIGGEDLEELRRILAKAWY
ncbi:regulatory protein, MarR family [Azotobacter vinelandii CA]|uniref:Regulatory protein, MarR family n=2 Tax=Azotobacter vinelandii TaxID=354 RepID=C1DSI9_AZOVD|nr:MarR family transcriptional regulator [Azotobacter vinelandii]ACO77944.1 regulatory protein, MarR family [Azotobacter vinelandii DJ]AGK15207.1 regulatory protein, MarR family [Azotobacter vinelandii CA]AGK20108.1 regulatory protein, MarR family [Azotobacter vinelandii CA6]WKN23677.1 MarR family transcriptional regulator [Azotobacter vinelandii]SFX99770.1 transcriptional regulator, MarR family [Azotobacter vinelandii]